MQVEDHHVEGDKLKNNKGTNLNSPFTFEVGSATQVFY